MHLYHALLQRVSRMNNFGQPGFNSIQGDAAINEEFHKAVIKGSILS